MSLMTSLVSPSGWAIPCDRFACLLGFWDGELTKRSIESCSVLELVEWPWDFVATKDVGKISSHEIKTN